MNHHIVITFEKGGFWTIPVRRHIKRCITAAFDFEKVPFACEINVLVCGDDTIRALNHTNRQIDKATDVLSFPMFQFEPGVIPENYEEFQDPGTGLIPLGDMAISYERAVAQAKEYGHSAKREVGYLTIHSVLHLLGYDHVDEADMKRQMRAEEEKILAEIVLKR